MTSVDSKLFAWHRLYQQLQIARQRLKERMAGADDAALRIMVADVEGLQQELDDTLREIDRLRAARPAPDQPRTTAAE